MNLVFLRINSLELLWGLLRRYVVLRWVVAICLPSKKVLRGPVASHPQRVDLQKGVLDPHTNCLLIPI